MYEEYPLLLLPVLRLKLIFGETSIERVTNKASKIADATKYFFNLNKQPFLSYK